MMSKKHAAEAGNATEPSPPVANPPDLNTVPAEALARLQTVLAAAEQEAARNRDGYLRMAAELDNLRKRSQRDLENAHKFALERFLQELLPVKDSLEAGIAAAGQHTDSVREGLDLTLKMLGTVLERFGVSEINPVKGAAFDPEVHEAMTMQPSVEAPPGTVLHTVQKGYLLNSRLLRPARVIVAKNPDFAA